MYSVINFTELFPIGIIYLHDVDDCVIYVEYKRDGRYFIALLMVKTHIC